MESGTLKADEFVNSNGTHFYNEINDAQYAISARDRSRLFLDNYDASGNRFLTFY